MKSSLCEDKEDIFYFSSLAVLIVGGALNIAVLLGILRGIKLRGTFCFVLQLVLCDVLSLWIFPLKQWILPDFCEVFYGLEIVAGTATTYIILAVNFHAVSTHNLAVCHHLKELQRRQQHTECCSLSDESAGNELKVRRTITIDYNRMKRSISAILPTVTIWMLATSMALPHVLSLHSPESTINLCCSLGMHISRLETLPFIVMIVFQIAIPTLGLIGGVFLVGVKLTTFQLDLKKCKLAENVKEVLVFSLILTLTFVLLSLQSSALRFLAAPDSPYTKYLSISHCFMPAIRPFIYLTTLKHLRRSIMMFFTV